MSRDARVVVLGHVDHGKSTLIGRLLYDTGSLPAARIEEIVASSRRRGLQTEWSFALDALQDERDQAVTIDTTRVWFRLGERRFAIIDAPGHEEFLANAMTGA
ncbi:MAG: bifunctional enzyme CysN/CysC, partial [Candidatus Eremiobacteraeota bacterium]|nr:bifunctional enzyme CysN/CysC [Candidatus Eremiobacteraeota bacterium]